MIPFLSSPRRAALGAIVASLIAVSAVAGEVVTQQSFPVTAGGRLVIDADRGSITVVTAETNAVGITVLREVKGADAAKTEEILAGHMLDFAQDGNTVRVHARTAKKLSSLWKQGGVRVQYQVTVPRQFDLQLKTAGGGISLGDISGNVELETAGGSLKTGRIEGSLKAETAGGSIRADSVTGDVAATTAGGSIELGTIGGTTKAETAGGSIRVKSARGDIHAETAGGSIDLGELSGAAQAETSGGSIAVQFAKVPSGDTTLETSGGSATVVLPNSPAFAVDAEASGGRVSSEVPVETSAGPSKTKLKGHIGSGGPALKIRVSGGSIHLKASPAKP